MVGNEQMRELALALPEANEGDHFGEPSFRVGKRIFAVLYRGDRRAVLKLPLDAQETLAEGDPETYGIGNFAHQGWTQVDLKRVPKAHFRHHLETAWRGVAPKRAIRVLEANPGH